MYDVKDTNIVGNISAADEAAGFKDEVRGVFESYAQQGINLSNDLVSIVSAPASKQSFIEAMCESMTDSPLFTKAEAASDPFYSNYHARVDQLMDNSLKTIAQESVMTGYAPIVCYTPFFLKKQWIDCIFKDVLMTEIPKTPVINLGFEKRYLQDLEGNSYSLPEALYDDALCKKLMDAATGLSLSEDPIDIATCKKLSLIDPKYIPGVIAGDHTVELTPNTIIFKVVMADSTGATHEVPTNIGVDITTHNFVRSTIKYDVLDTDGTTKETLEDELIGKIDFDAGTLSVVSTTGAVTKVCLRGKTANRFNQRSLSVVRKNEQIQKQMPESGPHLNTSVTIEEASDALALQNIDMIADNINTMGSVLANFEDAEIKSYLLDSFEAQKRGNASGIRYDDYNEGSLIVESRFNTLPPDNYGYTLTEWINQSREYFERTVAAMKKILRSSNMVIVAVAHPNIIRFLQQGINWVFSDDTQISGVKLSYNFGIYTTAQDRVHILTSMRLKEEDGIRFIAIPLTNELITFKHYKYNVCIDRNYRNPLTPLTPNIMTTQRTLTFEVLPVQGAMFVDGREMISPETYARPTGV